MVGIAYFLGGRVYDFLDEYFEKTRYRKIREKMLSDVTGNILEAGCGTGRNFTHYLSNVSVVAFDSSSKMLNVARERAKRSRANIKLKKMNITKINFSDNTFDNIIATFILCVLPAKIEKQALDELVRVTKPNAKMYFLEYVYSKNKLRKFIMGVTSFIPKLLFSIRFNTTYSLIKDHPSLKIEKTEFVYDDVIRLIVARKK